MRKIDSPERLTDTMMDDYAIQMSPARLLSRVRGINLSYLLLSSWLLCGTSSAQIFDERFEDWPMDLKINGTIIVSESTRLPDECLNSLSRDPKEPSLLVLSNQADSSHLVSYYSGIFEQVRFQPIQSFQFETPLDVNIVVWQDNRQANEIPQSILNQAGAMFRDLIQRGKTLVLLGPHAKALSQVYINGKSDQYPSVTKGLNLLPNCVVETDFDASTASKQQVLSLLSSYPRCVGIGVDRESALVLRGRKMVVYGPGNATFLLAANERQPIRIQSISQLRAENQDPEDSLIDLTQWRRDAIDRTLEPFPPADPGVPHIENGKLIIVGGGGLPDGLMVQFVELAGGADHAKLVYVPCEESDQVSPEQSIVKSWQTLGVRTATTLHTKNRVQAHTDEEFYSPLIEATGIWFGGGRQWNFADSYYGTTTHRLMKEVLKRGGVIGGSSAGATVQARYLARATPIQNFKIMAPGYERGGLGFLSGVAIDQHFSQRGRQPDMTQLVNTYPQLLGIGIDESTALTVEGSIAKVSGAGKVYFYDRRQPVVPDRPDFIALEQGQVYDLAKRVIIPTQE